MRVHEGCFAELGLQYALKCLKMRVVLGLTRDRYDIVYLPGFAERVSAGIL